MINICLNKHLKYTNSFNEFIRAFSFCWIAERFHISNLFRFTCTSVVIFGHEKTFSFVAALGHSQRLFYFSYRDYCEQRVHDGLSSLN